MPRVPVLDVVKVAQEDNTYALASYSISWQPPLYLGGLNLTDIKYNVCITNNSITESYTTNNTFFNISQRVHRRLLKVIHFKVHVVSTQIKSKYLPTNVWTKATYKSADFIKTAISK